MDKYQQIPYVRELAKKTPKLKPGHKVCPLFSLTFVLLHIIKQIVHKQDI